MTLPEAQTLRTALLAGLQASAGGVVSYSINGRSVTRTNPTEALKAIAQLDNLIARMSGGTFTVAQFRDPE